MKKRVKRNIIALIITIVLVGFLLSQINLSDVYSIVNNLKPIYLLWAFLIFIISQFLRALRFKILFNQPINLLSLFKITSLGILANQILPARTGEASYPYLFKKVHDFPLSQGVSVLISARILDLCSIIIFFLLSLWLVISDQAIKIKIFILGIIVLLITIIILFSLFFFGWQVLKLIKKIIALLKLNNFKFSNYFYSSLEKVIDHLSVVRSPRIFFSSFLFSFLIWLTMYYLAYTLIHSLGLEFGFFEAIFVSTFSLITSVLPIHGFLGFGTTEGAWAIGMLLLGYSKELSISTGFGIHLVTLFFSLLVFAYSSLTIKFKK